jgi:hypothetical protein
MRRGIRFESRSDRQQPGPGRSKRRVPDRRQHRWKYRDHPGPPFGHHDLRRELRRQRGAGAKGQAVDGKGNIYVAGDEEPVNLAQPPGTTATEGAVTGAFLLQYSPTGELMWRQPFTPGPNTLDLEVVGVAVQPTTGVEIVLGALGGTVTIGGTTLSSSVDPTSGNQVTNLWLTAVDSAGYVVWTKVIPSTGYVFPDHVFTTSSGDIEVTGGMTDNASVGGPPLCCGNGITGPRFVARYSPTGDHLWSYGVTGYFSPIGADADADGGLVVAGIVNGDFGYRGSPSRPAPRPTW